MSADNGIYILKTKEGQIRVIHDKAIDNIFDSNESYNSTQLVQYFGQTPYTRDMNVAVNIAQRMYKAIPYCEYGIVILPECDKTWNQIMREYNTNSMNRDRGGTLY